VQEILDQVSCVVARWRPDGEVTYLNAAGRRLLGEDAGGQGAAALLGLAPQELRRLLEDLAQPGEISTRSESGASDAGDHLVLHWTHRPLRDGAGAVREVVSTGADITPYHALARSLAESEGVFNELADNLEQCVWIKDPSTATTGKMTYVSPAFERVVGLSPEALYGQPDRLFELVHPEDLERFRESITRQFEKRYDIEYRVLRPDGTVRWLWSRAAPVCDDEGRVIKLVGITEDITRRKQDEQRIRELNAELQRMYRREQELSRTDELTGIGNRHRYAEEADKLWKIIRREAQRSGQARHLAAILVDLDGFKQVNDRHGHGAGDACLRAAARTIAACVREVDVPARLGGDEFIVLLPYTTVEEARQVAARICRALSEEKVTYRAPDAGEPVSLRLSASLGVAAVDALEERAGVETLYSRADEALYAAKAAGRGQVAAAPHS
jgi:diguanylate cyclase (GGDEF)-like protein/PAS domain S-box-containing protein